MHWMAFDDCILPQGNIKLLLLQQQQQNDLLKKCENFIQRQKINWWEPNKVLLKNKEITLWTWKDA
jgi:hypothetical protein